MHEPIEVRGVDAGRQLDSAFADTADQVAVYPMVVAKPVIEDIRQCTHDTAR
ncbi:MAG TPA: hypothetical protein VGO93_29665 [Candidatus Xenobia bacterium]|jgi:hypothetical protein